MASKLVKTSTIISMDEEGASSGITSGQERSRNFLNASWVQAILGFVRTKYSTNFDLSCPLKTAEAGPRAPQTGP